MNQLQKLFQYQGKQVRTVVINGEVNFVLKDVCEVLDLAHRVVRQRLSDDVCTTYPIEDQLGRMQDTTVINEDGLYDVILESRKPEAKAFRKWVTGTVLPSIRKTGSFNLDNPQQLIAVALIEAQKLLESKDQQIAIMKPKAEFFDQVANSKSAIDFNSAAKVLKLPGMGRNNLFEFLRNEGILMQNNQPYQRYIDAGLFRVIEQKYTKPNGDININIKTLVYQKGLDYIRKLYEKKKELVTS